tara:strand:+ start:1302 stop:1538 length:237 start_codon:yes stop_codon:yes gene_type:complete
MSAPGEWSHHRISEAFETEEEAYAALGRFLSIAFSNHKTQTQTTLLFRRRPVVEERTVLGRSTKLFIATARMSVREER